MQDKILYIIVGANRSGKSTLASELLPNKDLEFLNADDIAKEICPEKIESVKIKAGKIVLRKLDELLNSNKPFARYLYKALAPNSTVVIGNIDLLASMRQKLFLAGFESASEQIHGRNKKLFFKN